MKKHRTDSALWQCPTCGRTFANTHQAHTCGPVRSLDDHFSGKPPLLRLLFDRILEVVNECGPVTVLPEKTRIAFHARMSFMVVSVQRGALRGHFVFSAVEHDPRFTKIETYSPRNHVHAFRVTALSDIDDSFRRWVARAYAVGQQWHLRNDEA